MRRNKFLLPLLLGLLVIVSCSKESMIQNKSATDKLNDLGIIPLEQEKQERIITRWPLFRLF